MRRQLGLALSFSSALACVNVAHAQFGRGAGDWTTGGGDGQRSSWVRNDPKISRDSLLKPGFQFLWKVKLNTDAAQSNPLTPAVLLDRYIGYRGFRSLAFVGNANHVAALDTDLGKIEWQKNFTVSSAPSGTPACMAGMTANLTRPTSVEYPAPPTGGRGGGGRGGPARSGVGQANAGAVTLVEVAAPRGGAPGGPPAPGAPGGRAPNRGGGGGGARAANFVYGLSTDGMLHAMYVSNGEEPDAPVPFVPANSNAHGLIVVDGVAYAATSQGCGVAADGIWALDLATKQVTSWKSANGSVAGSAGPAFGPDGTLYVSTANGGLLALAPKTLAPKGEYSGKQALTTTPVIFPHKEGSLIAVTTKDGRMLLLDSANLGGTPVHQTAAYTTAADFHPGALATWQDPAGTRWILAPSSGALASEAKFPSSNGSITNGALVAWRLVEKNGAPALEPAWASRDLIAPLPPMILNGVVFAVSSGTPKGMAVLYALDGASGKDLWNSGKTMTSYVRGGGLSGGSGQLYLGTNDGTLYAFGFPIEH